MTNHSTATTQVIPFRFEKRQVRTLLIDDQPWFVAGDVASALLYSEASAMTRHLDEDEKGLSIVQTPGGGQEMLVINESGLYSAILRSRKGEAKRFKKWVTAEVLPAIRRHGRYVDAEGKMTTLLGQTIGTDGFHMLGALVKGKVSSLPVAVQRRATAKIWSQTHAAFGVRSAEDIPAGQLDSARNFIAAYTLEGEWLGRPDKACGTALDDHQLYSVFFLITHFKALEGIFSRNRMYEHLSGLGSRIGVEMHDHFQDGRLVVHGLNALAPEFEAAERRLELNRHQPGVANH
ncbi:hypothetical protein EXN22_16160 [Pseudomonas tructae]|uniref:Bro-N domain-containing protein n=1 Tax=Pseudomonas tructae TaxID=2518644 RepID=A0A411MK31_9PSED|nr:Bro-N domain-containing protein [Pseudomonas tructae]QBF27150.1 hypothetical protein EXN22_16160 [Pseudomonas tructae]